MWKATSDLSLWRLVINFSRCVAPSTSILKYIKSDKHLLFRIQFVKLGLYYFEYFIYTCFIPFNQLSWTSNWYWSKSFSVKEYWTISAMIGKKGRSNMDIMYDLCPVLFTKLMRQNPVHLNASLSLTSAKMH